jgi:hypothetical protein
LGFTLKKLFFIGGYARAGKTRAMEHLQAMGAECFSTSKILDETLVALTLAYGLDLQISDHEDRRREKIRLAEEILVPIFSRQLFAAGVAARVAASPSDLLAIETLGGEEFECLKNQLALTGEFDTQNINIRSKEERPGCDIRVLLPGAIDVWNFWQECPSDLYFNLIKILIDNKVGVKNV